MRRKMKRAFLPKLRWYLLVLLAVVCTILLAGAVRKILTVIDETDLTPVTVAKLLFNGGTTLKQTLGRTNILLLGIGGNNHEGGDLTDTMILMSLGPDRKTMSLLSLPRDIWSETLQDKINSAYHYGEEKRPGGGLVLAKVAVEDIIGVPVHYALVIDFSQFRTLIDQVGGIDVDVSVGFTDTQYPVAGKENDDCDGDARYRCRYRTVSFTPGLRHMDGERALIYVRSRHADGDEGSDFARGRRQQEVLVALKDKLFRFSELVKVQQDLAVLRTLDEATDTDMSIGELLTIAKRAGRVKSSGTKRVSIEQLFVQPPQSEYGGRYVLVPQESPQAIAQYVSERL